MPVPRLIHRFKDRVVILANSHCAMRCRFCFRKREWANGASLPPLADGELEKIIRYLQEHHNEASGFICTLIKRV